MDKSNIVISGFMASGKTTVGTLLAGITGMALVDTDALVEQETGRAIKEIFAFDGEAVFRGLERQIIARESAREGVVMAVGGGAVLDPENVRALKARGVIYFLEVSPEEVVSRVLEGDDRPLLSEDEAGIESLMEARDPAYRRAADFVVITTGQGPGEVAGVIAADFESRRPGA